LAPSTQEHVSRWLALSRLEYGALFRGLHTGSVSKRNLDTSSIRRIVKAAARRAGLKEEALKFSGHSLRIGAAQDLMNKGLSTLAIMTAGGWKTSDVVARYVERRDPDGFILDAQLMRWMEQDA